MVVSITFARNLGDLEYRVLEILYANSRTPVKAIADQLGVSRSTVSRIISKLVAEGVITRFTLEVGAEARKYRVFVKTSVRPVSGEYYPLIGGEYLAVASVSTVEDLSRVLSELREVSWFGVGFDHVSPATAPPLAPVCDECGKIITDQPLAVKVGRRTYHACCETCRSALSAKLGKGGRTESSGYR